MKSLYEAATVEEVRERLEKLTAESPRQWGKMDAAQMMAHCSAGLEMGVGERVIPRMWIGRILGPLVKAGFTNEKPLHKNGPTAPQFVVTGEREVRVEREKLMGLVERFSKGGVEGCTKEPHCFFGKLTAEEWGKGMYKHLDHHLQQFGV